MISNLRITEVLENKLKYLKKLVLVGAMGITLTACTNESSYDYDRDSLEYETNEDDYVKSDDSNDGLNNTYNDIKYEIDEIETSSTEQDYNDNQYTTEIDKENLPSYDDLLLNQIINSEVQFNSENLEMIISKINSIEIEYLHSQYFEIEKAMAKYDSTKLNQISSDFNIIINHKLNENNILQIIKNNNEEYLKENSSITRYKKPSDYDLNQICKWICDSINYELENTDIDIDSLEVKLSNLKVLEVSDFTYGAYTAGEELITYNKNTINSSNRSTAFEETICHEVKHLCQSKNQLELDNTLELVMGTNYSWSDLKVNSLYNEWLMESAAEKQTMNQMDLKSSLNYGIHLTAFDSMEMSMIVTKEVGELEKICMQSDLQKLYDYFDATTTEEKYEISLMMYATNIYIKDSTLTTANDFYKYYEEETGYKFDVVEKSNYRDSLRGSVGQTLSKIFYKNLSQQIAKDKVSIKDIFELISGFELQLSYQCRCYDSLVAPNIQDFYSNYNVIQELFFENIAMNLNLTEDEVQEAYQKYYDEYKTTNKVSILSVHNREFLQEKSYNNLDTFYELDTITKYLEKYSQNNCKSK